MASVSCWAVLLVMESPMMVMAELALLVIYEQRVLLALGFQ